MRFSKYDNMFQSKSYDMIAINERHFTMVIDILSKVMN